MLHVIMGPPCAGKSTFVREHAAEGDIIIDLDHLANALAGKPMGNHEHTGDVLTVAKAARQAAIDTALTREVTVWLIHTNPSDKQRAEYEKHGAKFHTIDPGKAIVMKRCEQQRPHGSAIAAAKWYDERKAKPKKNARQRGYTHHAHDVPRKRLLMALKDGTPCWWCGLPMHKDKRRNWDGQALAADHSNAHGARNGEKPDRLLHSRCNSQRQDGRYDARRPALTGKHPSEPLATQAGVQALQRGQQDGDAAAFVWK